MDAHRVFASDSAREMMAGSVNTLSTDGWGNILTGLGRAERDKRLQHQFGNPTVLSQTQLDRLYAGDWRIARIVDRPAADQTRRWIDIVVDGRRDQADQIEKRMRELDAKMAFVKGISQSRLHGTALGIVWTADGAPMDKPLDVESIRKVESIRVVDRWDMSVSTYIGDTRSMSHGLPEIYQVNSRIVDFRGEMMAPRVHWTRVLRWDGVMTSRRRIQENGGWADSVVTRVYEIVRDWDGSIGGAAHLTTDFAQAVFKIKGLAKMLAEDKDQKVLDRLKLIDMARSIARLVPIDEDEEFERKPTPITGLPALLEILRDELIGATGIPEKILFGKATAGLGDQGQSDLEQYYNDTEGEQSRNVIPQATTLTEMIMAELKFSSTDWQIVPRPLWTPTDKEISENRLKDAQADAIRITNSILLPHEIRDARYGGDVYGIDLQIDTDDPDAEGGGGADPTTDPIDDPGLDPGAGAGETTKGQLDPKATLNGGQISGGISIIEKTLAQEITIPAARVLLRVGLGVDPQDIEEMLSGAEETIAARELKAAAMQAQIAAGQQQQPPGDNDGDNNNPNPKPKDKDDGDEEDDEEDDEDE